jgi:hypothetical protein
MYLQDAVTALGILDVDPAEWHPEGGYPAFCFGKERVENFNQRLAACGYAVRIIPAPEASQRPAVLDASGRCL